jgi:redox-sensitive bicupin YhaK (pirin superfamily)
MSLERRFARVVTAPPLERGFVGAGHLASQVLAGQGFAATDPFIMLADDHLDIGDRAVGGAHPHAGFETVTLLLEGAIYDRDEGGVIDTGEVQWMTAGRGIIHGENVAARGKVRLLQLWLTLPKDRRATEPRFQDLHREMIPVHREPGVHVRLYSGRLGILQSPLVNHVPVLMTEVVLQPHASFSHEVPAAYNGFAFVIRGSVRGGDDAVMVETGQVGWLDRLAGDGSSRLRLTAGAEGARLVFYAGEPQGDPIVSHGPFIADSREDITRLYAEFRAGRFERMSNLARAARAG